MSDTNASPTVEQVLQGMAAQMGKTPEVMELMAEIKPEMVLENARNQRFANEGSSIPEKYRTLITIATVAGSGTPTCLKTQIGLALRRGATPARSLTRWCWLVWRWHRRCSRTRWTACGSWQRPSARRRLRVSDEHGHAPHDHAGHSHVHAAPDTLGPKLLAGVFINLLIFVTQVVGGLLANSLGLLSDAAHNLSDVVSLLMSYGANRTAKLPPTPKHTFAFRRVEILVAFFNSTALIAIAAFVAFEGVKRLIGPVEVGGATVMLVAGIGMLANTGAAWLLKGHDDLNARSAFLHLVADAVTSLGVVVGGFVVWAFHFNAADALVSIGLSAWMVKEAWGIAKSSLHILFEGTPEGLDFWEISEAIKAVEGVNGVHALHVWAISSKEFALSAHIEVDDERLSDLTQIVRRVKEMLLSSFEIGHPTLEVECDFGGCAGGVCALSVEDGEAKRKLEELRVAGEDEG